MKMAPSSLPRRKPVSRNGMSTRLKPIMTITSIPTACRGTLMGRTRAVTPRMPSTLKLLEPTMLPRAISDSFFSAAISEVASSNRLVPTQAQDEAHVGDVRAHHNADRNLRAVLESGDQAGRQFRRRGAESDDRQANHQRA